MKTAIAALCIASANAAHVIHRKRNINVEYKSINTEGRRLAGDEEYEPYLGMERELKSMSMSMSMPSMTEVETMGDIVESSAVSAGSAVSVLAIAGAMMLL